MFRLMERYDGPGAGPLRRLWPLALGVTLVFFPFPTLLGMAVVNGVVRRYDARHLESPLWSRDFGWNLREFPEGMTVGAGQVRSRKTSFTCAGIKDLVSADVTDKGPVFSFTVPDRAAAKRVSDALAGRVPDVDFSVRPDGVYVVRSSSPASINAAVEAAYPPRDVVIRQESSHVRQYIVPGPTLEEAAARLKADPDSYPVVNSFLRTSVNIDGVSKVRSNGSPLDAGSPALSGGIPVGSVVVSVSETDTFESRVRLPGSAGEAAVTEAVRRFVPDDSTRVGSGPVTTESDATPEGVRRVATLSGGRTVDMAPERSLHGMRACALCDSPESLREILDSGVIPAGVPLVVGSELPPALLSAGFPVVFDIDSASAGLLLSQDVTPEDRVSVASAFPASGVSADAGAIGSAVSRDGYATVFLSKGLPLDKASGARVGRVPAGEVLDRLANPSLVTLDSKGLKEWVDGAGRIDSVTYTLDAVTGNIRITSVVDGVARPPIERPATARELEGFRERGLLTRAEMKERLMRSETSTFREYNAHVAGLSAKASLSPAVPAMSPTLKHSGIKRSRYS